MNEWEQKFADERDRRYTEVAIERDRRYMEVAVEREKALKIKDEADKVALGLARKIQTYKDEKANELREQIAGERNLYITKAEMEAAIREINIKLVSGAHWTWQHIAAFVGIMVAIGAIYFRTL